MKKITYIFIFFTMLFAASCDKAFVNGDLDGMWRLVKVEKDGGEIYPENIYYSFQRHLVMMGIYAEEGTPSNYYMGVFARNGNSMLMNNFYRYPGVDDKCDPAELAALCIFDEEVHFIIENLGSEVLVMSTDSGNIRYYFRKW